MNRLTSEDGQLYACGNGLCSDGNIECANCRYANEAFLKLAKYENVGLQPEHIDSIIKQLLGYLDAEQAGLLIELPCKVGDTVYYVNLSNKVINYTVSGFKVDCFGNLQINVARHLESGYFLDMQLGKTVFLTREEAEKALNKEE